MSSKFAVVYSGVLLHWLIYKYWGTAEPHEKEVSPCSNTHGKTAMISHENFPSLMDLPWIYFPFFARYYHILTTDLPWFTKTSSCFFHHGFTMKYIIVYPHFISFLSKEKSSLGVLSARLKFRSAHGFLGFPASRQELGAQQLAKWWHFDKGTHTFQKWGDKSWLIIYYIYITYNW